MFKKWFSAIACAVMLLTMFTAGMTVWAAPADSTVFTLSVTEGTVGDTVTVSVSLSENSYFTNATFYLHYDASKVAFVEDSLETGEASPSGKAMFDVFDYKDKHFLKGAYVTVSGIKKAGKLIQMDFKVLEASPAPFSLSFDECIGVNENDTEFELNYSVVGCVLNNDGSVTNPTGDPVVITTKVTTTTTVQNTTATVSQTTTTANKASTTVGTAQSTLPTMIVTDQGNNKITIPVVTTTDAGGNVATVPVAVVTNVQGSTVTVPVAIVTDAAGSVATIPVATGTDKNGNEVTIPVAIVTDADGNVETVPVATATDASGNIVTVLSTTTDPTEPAAQNSGLTTGIILVVVCVVVAVGVAIVAMKLRKKKDEPSAE